MRTWPITVAAATPWPTTSPMTNAVAPDGSRMTSNQSPPTLLPVAAGRYRVSTSRPGMSGATGSMLRDSSVARVRSRS